jgi:hypothetical protein
MARWFPRFASRIAFRCVLHPRESRDIRRRELFRGFSFTLARVAGFLDLKKKRIAPFFLQIESFLGRPVHFFLSFFFPKRKKK